MKEPLEIHLISSAKQFDPNYLITGRSGIFSRYRPGFSLIVTLMMMILLMVIAVGLLSLATITARSSQEQNAQARAKANARMALFLAIGQLQKTIGPDQRVTATADIRPSVAEGNRHWTGVWNTQNWKVKAPGEKTFVSWLVSDPAMMMHTEETEPSVQRLESVSTVLNDDSAITLVGKGTLGDSISDGEVKVPSITLQGASGTHDGSLAYWISDEGVKARYDLEEADSPTDFSDQLSWSASPSLGMQKIQGLEDYASTKDKRGKILSLPTVKLDAPAASGSLYHDVTTDSDGLPVDVREGGTKRDLSLAFELPLTEFNAIEEFHNAQESNNTSAYAYFNPEYVSRPEFYPFSKLGYLFQIPSETKSSNPLRVRGPTWDLLRNHYRLYKKDWDKFEWPRKLADVPNGVLEARGSMPLSYSTGSASQRYSPRADEGLTYHWSTSNQYQYSLTSSRSSSYSVNPPIIMRTAGRIAPIVTRATFVFGLVRKKNDTLGVSISPYFTILNPYDTPIEFYSLGFYSTKFFPFLYDIVYTDQSGNEQTKTIGTTSSSTTYLRGTWSFRLDPATTGGKTQMNPGEMLVVSPFKVDGGQTLASGAQTSVRGTTDYEEDTSLTTQDGISISGIQPNSSLKLKIRSGAGGGNVNVMVFSMFLPKLHKGEARPDLAAEQLWGGGSDNFHRDSMDDPFLMKLSYSSKAGGIRPNDGLVEIDRTINLSQIPKLGEEGAQFVGAYDMWLKDFDTGGEGSVPVLAQFNPRPYALDPRDHDGTWRVNPSWRASLLKLTDISDLNLVNAGGLGGWGGGVGAGVRPDHVVLYEVPRTPLASLASLQHADVAIHATDAPYAIGNSFPPPAISKDKIVGHLPLAAFRHPSTTSRQWQIDFSWAANESIWDRYFFSGFNWGEDGNLYTTKELAATAARARTSSSPFANPRVHVIGTPATHESMMDYATIAKHLAIKGAFNINSTSVEAWKAVLAGLDGKELAYRLNDQRETGQFDSPLSRFSTPQGDDSDSYRGFRSLSDTQLENLAKEIVKQVKQRGPFMGLADFVNRRLTNEYEGDGGVLQAAIDGTDINMSLHVPPDKSVTPNAADSTAAGLPGYLTQADILTSIGASVTARSDTFKIRAYGDVKDSSGKVTARAWCEAVVQRIPEWTSPTNEEPTMPNAKYPMDLDDKDDLIFHPNKPNPEFPESNLKFGRRLIIVGFRWLSPEEI